MSITELTADVEYLVTVAGRDGAGWLQGRGKCLRGMLNDIMYKVIIEL